MWVFSPFTDHDMVVFYKGSGGLVILASLSGRSFLMRIVHFIQDLFEAVFYT